MQVENLEITEYISENVFDESIEETVEETQESVVFCSEQFDKIIYNLELNNTISLFFIAIFSGVFVIYILYQFTKKFY